MHVTPRIQQVMRLKLTAAHMSNRRKLGDRGEEDEADERALLRALVVRIRALDPDLIIGWTVIDFDLRVLARRAAHK